MVQTASSLGFSEPAARLRMGAAVLGTVVTHSRLGEAGRAVPDRPTAVASA